MDLAQFGGRERRNAVLLHENAQFVASVDREFVSAGLDQCRAGGLVRAEENGLLKDLRKHHDEGQAKQVEQLRFVQSERVGKVLRPGTGRFHVQRVGRRETERETEVRGCNVWFRVIGESCPTTKIKTADGRNWGEFRGSGSQTIIYGKHPSGCDYRLLVEAPPVQIDISEIVWPNHVIDPFSKQNQPLSTNHSSVFCIPVSCASMSCVPVPLCDIAKGNEVLVNIEAANQRREALKQRFPQLADLYEKFIEPKFEAAAGHRNGFIVEAAPFIYRVVCVPLALRLLDFFYQMHRHLFKDTQEQHHYEGQKMLESLATSYRDGLNDIERKIYETLPGFTKMGFASLETWPCGRSRKAGRLNFLCPANNLVIGCK